MPAAPLVIAVSADDRHRMSKPNVAMITLLAGLGVAGDAHRGARVQHRSRVRRDPSQPNLRQVHLIGTELHERLRADGFAVDAGQLGENITTAGLDLLALPTGATLSFPGGAVIEITGLRNPCRQLDGLAPGLMKAVLDRGANGDLIRKAGVMGIVLAAGEIRPGEQFGVCLSDGPATPLRPV